MSETKPETAVVPAQPQQVARPDTRAPIAMTPEGLRLETFEALWRFAVTTVASGFAPSGFVKPEQVVAAVQYGAEIGLRGPMTSLRSIHVIKGQPSLAGQAALALCWQRGVFARVEEIKVDGEGDARTATFTARRKGQEHDFSASFSIADARRAGLLGKDNWKGSPDDMLTWRAVGRWMKRYAPDVLMGMPITEEATDHPSEPARGATPALPAAQPSGLGLLATLDADEAPAADSAAAVEVTAEVVAAERVVASGIYENKAALDAAITSAAVEPFDVDRALAALQAELVKRTSDDDAAQQLEAEVVRGLAMTAPADFDEAMRRLRAHQVFGDAANTAPKATQPELFDGVRRPNHVERVAKR